MDVDEPSPDLAAVSYRTVNDAILAGLLDVQDCKSLISFPFILSPAIKASILELEANSQMRREMEHEVQLAMFTGQRYVMPYFVLRVSRQNLVLDTLTQVSAATDL